MSKITIFDKAMCCSTGVCGPQVDPVLPRFAADLDWLKNQGVEVFRYNLAQEPNEFAKNEEVKRILELEGVDCLPIIIVDEKVVSRSEFPSRERLASWAGITLPNSKLNVAQTSCCSGSDKSSCC